MKPIFIILINIVITVAITFYLNKTLENEIWKYYDKNVFKNDGY